MYQPIENIINNVFSDKYVNRKAVHNNTLLLIMYRLAYPFATILNWLRLSPNQITTQSLIFAILAFISLIMDDGWLFFSISWGLCLLLDFCDGTVARMTDKVSKNAFRYDHMSDLFKIFLIIFGTGLRYNDTFVWSMASLTSFGLLYFDNLNQALSFAQKQTHDQHVTSNINSKSIDNLGNLPKRRLLVELLKSVVKYVWKRGVVKKIRSIILTINGHTLIIFFMLPFGPNFAIYCFAYLLFLELIGIRLRIVTLIHTRR